LALRFSHHICLHVYISFYFISFETYIIIDPKQQV
jgi:hypothetical protein